MSERVLVLGANGFIGSHVAAALSGAGWAVRAGARRIIEPARRAPTFDWVVADFAKLTTPQAWAPLLVGMDAVVNCVGVLQNGAGDSTQAAHIDGPHALIEACEAAGVRRLVHISAVGADDGAGTDYARTKAETERMIETSGLDWLILRPSLVVDRAAFGGTGLIRALAAFPLFSPVVGGDQIFRPISLSDLSAAIVAALKPGAPSRQTLDMPGPEPVTMVETVRLYRGWMSLKPAPVIRVPRIVAAPALIIGDLLGRLGWSSPIRTTAIKQMDHDVSGHDSGWAQALGIPSRGFTRFLAETPASVQDVWHARLWFVRPISILTLGLFWLITGLISFGPGWDRAVGILHEGGYGRWAGPIAWWGALLDVVLGLMLFVRRWTARVAIFMCLATVGYLTAATLSLPQFWIDPLGPWLKVLPMMALCLFVAATDARR